MQKGVKMKKNGFFV